VGVAVDVCHATDTPGNDKKNIGDVKLGEGPVLHRGPNFNEKVFQRMVDAGKKSGVPIQLRGIPKGSGTDANAMQVVGSGVAMGLIGIPNRYMHSPVEMVSLKDLEGAAQLLAEFCMGVSNEDCWIPE
jgi:endoglucanase